MIEQAPVGNTCTATEQHCSIKSKNTTTDNPKTITYHNIQEPCLKKAGFFIYFEKNI